jgi:hypothetical protein
LWSANFQKIDELFGSKRHNPNEKIHPAIFIDEYSPKGSYYRIAKFKVNAANELGITGAIIMEHFLYFLTHNLKSRSFLYENKTGKIVPFVPASAPMILKYFPFFTERKIRLALDLLVDKKLITLSRIPNKYATTRNLWATLHEDQWHYEK